MPSHAIRRLLRCNENGPDTFQVEAELECGCVVNQEVKQNRLVLTVDGTRHLAGKYTCPLAHPIGKR